ncbi:hypothetical protein LO749_20865 [Paracoccus denitrificans]|uniref:capsid assembly protein n=1 Tax=Paracoccus denitrificans TaxID=266 RepID=UPI001E40EA2B|nr:hypothetical protein [Paracoccus denitrificans]UFS66947.1 hypothetical protein LO749_20865 [Paracoccus denitrificans]
MSAQEFIITTDANTAAAPAPTDGRPENVPEEFWDAEARAIKTDALLTAYTDATKAKEEAQKVGDGEGEGDPNEAGKIAEAAGVDIPALEAHFAEHGEIPDDAYEKLAKVGISKETVDEFVSLRAAQAESIRKDILDAVGGEDQVGKMIEWAGQHFTEEQANAFNEATGSKDRAKIEMALAGLKVAYEKANPPTKQRPHLITPSTDKPSGGDTYGSFEELRRDQANPLYTKDPAFRRKVEEKLKRSKI